MCTLKFPRTPLARACALAVLAGGIGLSAPSIYAATAAGTQIKNLATVTYEDAAGNVYSAQSNEAIVTVAQVYSATIGVDVDATAAAGQTVYLPYVLTNTGNGDDIFDLTAVNGITGGDTIDASNITIFRDTNGSGEPDAGEPAVTSVSLLAGDIENLVVAVQVPPTAAAGATLGITLTAEAQEGTGTAVAASVTDLTAAGGRDTLDGTNESLITVTDQAVLVTTKSSVHDPVAQTISYTVTVRNNGNQSATNVVLLDGLPASTTLVSSGVSGLLASNGDTLNTPGPLSEVTIGIDVDGDGTATDTDEAGFGLDLNNDGDSTDANVEGVYAIDQELPPGTSVTMSFTVSYATSGFPGGYVVENQGHAAGDTDGDGTTDALVSSNVVQDAVDADYGVTIADTGTGALANTNDGGDDDALANDDQLVDQAAAGATVLFTNVITNTGNADDIFELTVDPGNFPTGTVFTLFDETGTVQLSDTNGSGVDSGVIASAASRTIIIKATLPAGASGPAAAPATEYQATVLAVSANDPQATPSQDTAFLSLGTIVESVADLHNATGGTIGVDEDPLGVAPYNAITTYPGQTGTTVSIPLYIDNESGGPDSFVLEGGSSYDGTALGAMVPGWSVEFFLGNGSGTATGAAITTTPVIPGGQTDFEIIAVVSIPADSTLAVDDFSYDRDGDGNPEVLDGDSSGPGDGDGDYPIFFRIASLNTGASDVKLDSVDVNATRQVSLVTPSSGQVEPGGTIDFSHTLANAGNVDEVLEITSTNSQTGFTHTIQIDTDGDGSPDTALGSLVPGVITVQQGDGTTVTVTVTDVDSDGDPELLLEPGFSLPLLATVFAPSNAAPGTVDSLTIDATNVDPAGPSVSIIDQTTVINGQVQLTKTVAVDATCDGIPDGVVGSEFATIQTTGVEPGQCAIWRVTAVNSGAVDANNVTITDTVTAYSSYEAGSLAYCIGSNCGPTTVTDAANDDAGSIVSNNIVFYVGDAASPATGEGGVLVPGQQVTAQFAVRVQ